MDLRRFGVGHRRPDGPAGTTGIEGQVIESGPAGVIAELAFDRDARITPHTNPNQAWFVVIEGGGWVGVGDERSRVQAGDAVSWPPDVLHAAWTEGTHMRAIVVEFTAPPPLLPGVADTPAIPASTRRRRPVTRGEGRLADDPAARPRWPHGNAEGEPD